jgi:hypothetical protein
MSLQVLVTPKNEDSSEIKRRIQPESERSSRHEPLAGLCNKSL